LVGRETLASTAFGDGIAIPHPRNPLVVRIHEPHVLLCFLEEPVDFHAIDGQPVQVLFVLLSPSVRVHLQMLAKLAYALHDRPFMQLLKRAAKEDEILERLTILSASYDHTLGGTHARPGASEKP
jgi:PTS system nitrogen regulatory IIA component